MSLASCEQMRTKQVRTEKFGTNLACVQAGLFEHLRFDASLFLGCQWRIPAWQERPHLAFLTHLAGLNPCFIAGAPEEICADDAPDCTAGVLCQRQSCQCMLTACSSSGASSPGRPAHRAAPSAGRRRCCVRRSAVCLTHPADPLRRVPIHGKTHSWD